jgi:hypothetical protein
LHSCYEGHLVGRAAAGLAALDPPPR